MTDRSSAAITITGVLPASLIDNFIAIALDENLVLPFDDGDEGSAIFRAIEAGNEPLLLTANEAAGGQFENTEQFCREHGLTYSRGDDGHSTWTPTVVYWEPGMEQPREWTGTVDNHVPHLSFTQIQQHSAAGTLDAELALMARANALTGSLSMSAVNPTPP